MKIIIIGTAHPYRGGLAAYNERLARTFLSQGHEVAIWTFTLQYPSFLFPGTSQYREAKPLKDIPIHRKINAINPINWIKIGRQLAKAVPDLVIVKYWLPFFAPCFGVILRRIKGKATIISILDNVIPHEKRIGDRLLTQYFVNKVDAFIAMSKSVLKDLKQFDKNKPRCCSPHPLFDNFGDKIAKESARQYLNIDSKKRYILFFGLIRKYKGLDLLIEAFADPYFKDKDIELLIAGEFYTHKTPYMKLIENHPFKDKIKLFERFVPDEEVKYFFGASDLMVQPYRAATQSGVAQIAYHFNTPMVVTNVGGLAALCPDEKVGFVVAPNAQAITEALRRFFDDATHATRMQAGIEAEKEKYSWDILANHILKLHHDQIH